MSFGARKDFAAGTKVMMGEPGEIPEWSTWDDDKGRISGPVKKRLQSMFFRADRKISAEVVYIASEEERDRLRRKGRVKVRIRDQSGCAIVITADPSKLVKGR